jgi:outer membrane immunogenic protein
MEFSASVIRSVFSDYSVSEYMGVSMKKLLIAAIAAAAFCVAPAFAADMPVYKAPVVSPAYNWSGFYLGAHLGYDGESFDFRSIHTDTGLPAQSFSGGFHDVFAGFQAGYNYMIAPNILSGVEVDVSRNNGGASGIGTNDGAFGQGKLTWSGTARGRIGYAANNVLFYGTGGFAWGDMNLTRVQIAPVNPPLNPPPGTVENASTTRTGWTAGGGVEVGVMPNLAVKAEYRYTDYGTFNVAFPLGNRTWHIGTRSEEVLLGINYYFGSH